ncbi:expressed unknown protein [Seminavis robusta]|uniref:Uncharacterized protein n=1 Tax=Seminavis robusta TaxID=568900 RepID=A0A9N8DZB0_9STRA|nr:expressed unknown protein [Seminavis robusta]|eukprot:Sro491_g153651.1  (137) ;mRNA; f:26969-27379
MRHTSQPSIDPPSNGRLIACRVLVGSHRKRSAPPPEPPAYHKHHQQLQRAPTSTNKTPQEVGESRTRQYLLSNTFGLDLRPICSMIFDLERSAEDDKHITMPIGAGIALGDLYLPPWPVGKDCPQIVVCDVEEFLQ